MTMAVQATSNVDSHDYTSLSFLQLRERSSVKDHSYRMTKGNFSKRTAKPAFTTDIRNYSVCDYQNGIQLVTTRMKVPSFADVNDLMY